MGRQAVPYAIHIPGALVYQGHAEFLVASAGTWEILDFRDSGVWVELGFRNSLGSLRAWESDS